MTKLAPEWVRTSDPVIRSPARYRWTTAPASHIFGGVAPGGGGIMGGVVRITQYIRKTWSFYHLQPPNTDMYNTLQQSLDFILGSRYNTLRWHVYSSITTGSHAALRISQKITNNFVSSNFMRLDQNFRWFILQSLQIDYSQTVNSCQISQIAKYHKTPNGKGKKYKTGKWMTPTLTNHRS